MAENRARRIDQRALDKLLGKFFFGCNIPFVIVESDHLRNFIHALNPEYAIPTRKTLSNSILDASINELDESIVNIQTTEAVLLMDGWKNKSANTQNVVAMLRLDTLENRKYIYLKSWNFSNIRETVEALSELVNECIGIARDKYNLNIFAIITDNASNMVRMGRLINIWHVTCNSHSANLLSKSLVDNEFARQVNNLLKDFKNTALEAQLLERGGNRMVLIADTRWCSHRDAFRRCLRNLPLMQEIAQNHDRNQISNASYNLLFDPQFEFMLQDNILLLDPICELTNTCQQADCTIADATELWLKLDMPALNDEYDRLIRQRKLKAINVFGLAANLLHPRYRGRRFEENEVYINKVNQFFTENLPDQGLLELEEYRNGNGLFRDLFVRNYDKGLVFWKAAQIFYPVLSELAIKLQIVCASTGQLERLFSEWSYVHSTKRNRLSSARSSKLISLYYDSRLNDNAIINAIINQDEDEDF